MTPLSIVTTCKSRLQHLQQTLPLMLAHPDVEVIVVDYGCPQGTASWTKQHHPEVKVVAVHDDPHFNHARARNLGFAAAKNEYVAFVDADVKLMPGWWAWWRALRPSARTVYRRAPDEADKGTWGSFIAHRSDLSQVEGYDELFKGWGGEDDDLYQRLESVGCLIDFFPAETMASISHDDAERTRHQPMKRRLHSFAVARYYRTAKMQAMAFFRSRGELPLPIRQQIDQQIRDAFVPFVEGQVPLPPRVTLRLQAREGLTDRWHLAKQCMLILEPADIDNDARNPEMRP